VAKTGDGVIGLLRTGDVRLLLARYADLALAALVVSIVGMMIVPLPTPLLDLLISVNIAAAVTLLLVAIYVSDALKIATFPTLLLLTTLFRLALEVSATRLILLHADAGEVIRAFGNFVVAGNLVVGAVIFLILTMIQFLVISKGAERVAEVAARFTLDAMPGKQMSIDAELRAGHIDHNEARRRRAALARESQLFGSMDGAMKFVNGDAIAGIVVLAVHIVGRAGDRHRAAWTPPRRWEPLRGCPTAGSPSGGGDRTPAPLTDQHQAHPTVLNAQLFHNSLFEMPKCPKRSGESGMAKRRPLFRLASPPTLDQNSRDPL
jgi:hypothetical protein